MSTQTYVSVLVLVLCCFFAGFGCGHEMTKNYWKQKYDEATYWKEQYQEEYRKVLHELGRDISDGFNAGWAGWFSRHGKNTKEDEK